MLLNMPLRVIFNNASMQKRAHRIEKQKSKENALN